MKHDITYPKHAPILSAIEGGHLDCVEAMLENYGMGECFVFIRTYFLEIDKSSSYDGILKTIIKFGSLRICKMVVEKYWSQYGIRYISGILKQSRYLSLCVC
jgi:hypothetical protein